MSYFVGVYRLGKFFLVPSLGSNFDSRLIIEVTYIGGGTTILEIEPNSLSLEEVKRFGFSEFMNDCNVVFEYSPARGERISGIRLIGVAGANELECEWADNKSSLSKLSVDCDAESHLVMRRSFNHFDETTFAYMANNAFINSDLSPYVRANSLVVLLYRGAEGIEIEGALTESVIDEWLDVVSGLPTNRHAPKSHGALAALSISTAAWHYYIYKMDYDKFVKYAIEAASFDHTKEQDMIFASNYSKALFVLAAYEILCGKPGYVDLLNRCFENFYVAAADKKKTRAPGTFSDFSSIHSLAHYSLKLLERADDQGVDWPLLEKALNACFRVKGGAGAQLVKNFLLIKTSHNMRS